MKCPGVYVNENHIRCHRDAEVCGLCHNHNQMLKALYGAHRIEDHDRWVQDREANRRMYGSF